MNIHRIGRDASVLNDPRPDFLDMLGAAPGARPYVGPDQRAFDSMLASFEPGTAASAVITR